jgi:hypothetical protein
MKIPQDVSLKLSTSYVKGPLRPKVFIKITATSKYGGPELAAYVKSCPFLLRLRLWLATKRLLRALKKFTAFKDNQGL